LISKHRNFIKDVGAPEHTGSIKKDTKTEKTKNTRETRRKNTHKDPAPTEKPKSP
jgi:hypothetical protein